MVYEYWFSRIKGISAAKKRKLREFFGSGYVLYNIEETALKNLEFLSEKELRFFIEAKKETNIQEKYQSLEKKGIRFLPYFLQEYPEKLQDIHDAPYALYIKGKLPDYKKPTAAIVGARRCTSYGEQMAMEYGRMLATAGVQIISGMAKGIDSAGQRGALCGGGQTYAVLGNGVDICYPRENMGLYMDLQKSGGLISEQCPGEPPLSWYFPLRNRIISGLADVILVIEAKEKSGSLITADFALEQGRDIYALPGPVTSPMSQGCHWLIKQGAGILVTPDELMSDLKLEWKDETLDSDKNEKMLETTEKLVYSCLDLFPKNLGTLADETNLPVHTLMEALSSLEIDGYIKEIAKNYYIKVRRS